MPIMALLNLVAMMMSITCTKLVDGKQDYDEYYF